MRMSKYIIVEATGLSKLAEYVNHAIENGWQPLGGVSVIRAIGTPNTRAFQAMTKTEIPPPTYRGKPIKPRPTKQKDS